MVILVTPRLVDPIDCAKFPKYMPGEETRPPDDFELFLEGIMEAPRHPRAVVFHPRLYQAAYKKCSERRPDSLCGRQLCYFRRDRGGLCDRQLRRCGDAVPTLRLRKAGIGTDRAKRAGDHDLQYQQDRRRTGGPDALPAGPRDSAEHGPERRRAYRRFRPPRRVSCRAARSCRRCPRRTSARTNARVSRTHKRRTRNRAGEGAERPTLAGVFLSGRPASPKTLTQFQNTNYKESRKAGKSLFDFSCFPAFLIFFLSLGFWGQPAKPREMAGDDWHLVARMRE